MTDSSIKCSVDRSRPAWGGVDGRAWVRLVQAVLDQTKRYLGMNEGGFSSLGCWQSGFAHHGGEAAPPPALLRKGVAQSAHMLQALPSRCQALVCD